MQNTPNAETLTMTVDIRLCGNIPRHELQRRYVPRGAPCSPAALPSPRLNTSCFATINASEGDRPTLRKISGVSDGSVHDDRIISKADKTMRTVLQEKQPLTAVLEAPSWAVPARGESRLEPVCESIGRQSAVDLTSRNSFRIGRSPNSDIQLMHATSSRRHAMLFHHSNGSCYIVDCGSAHGTYVNGIRITSPASGGVVVPHKVRRGALIRFGGPGAPCFVLKSFSFHLEDLKKECPTTETPDTGALVRRNTRLNALGKTAAESVRENATSASDDALNVVRKRSFDSLSSHETLELLEPCCKRIRCSSPPLSPEAPLRLVSPDLPTLTASKPRRVTFSAEPPKTFYPATVTPEELSDQEDADII